MQAPDLSLGPDLLEGAGHGELELLEMLEGLLEIIGGARLHRLHRALDLAVARDDDHRDMGVAALERAEHVHAVHVREPQVEEHHVRIHLVGHLEPILAGAGSMDLDGVLRKDPRDEGPDVPFVVDDEDIVHMAKIIDSGTDSPNFLPLLASPSWGGASGHAYNLKAVSSWQVEPVSGGRSRNRAAP